METSSANVSRISPALILCRYKPGSKVDRNTARENLLARMAFPGDDPQAVITIFPRNVEFCNSLFDADQYGEGAIQARTRMLGFVAEEEISEAMIKKYLACHPTRVATQVFRSEPAALAWAGRGMEAI